MPPRLWAGRVLAIALCCQSLGCDHRATEGRTVIYSFAAWVPALYATGGVLTIILGWLLQRNAPWSLQRKWMGVLLMTVLAPVFLLIITPGTMLDRIVIDDDQFSLNTGIWWALTRIDVRFADLASIRVVARKSRNARNPGRVDYQLMCIDHQGGTRIVPVGDLMRQAAPEALARAKARGVVILDGEHLPKPWKLTH
jgi:hypothetical protein